MRWVDLVLDVQHMFTIFNSIKGSAGYFFFFSGVACGLNGP